MSEDPLDVPVRPIRALATRWAAAAIGWLAAAFTAWTAVLCLELAYGGGSDAPLLGRLGYLADQSMQLTLAASAPLLIVHLARVALKRTGRWQTPLVALVVLAVVAQPVREQALFLTSGGAVADWPWARELSIALFVVLAWAHYLGWRWHVAGLTAPGPERAKRSGLAAFIAGYAWSLGGTIALVGLVYLLSFQLKAYAYFARFLLLPTWMVAGTLLYRTAGGPARRPWSAAVLGIALIGASWLPKSVAPEAIAVARSDHLRRGKIAALNDVLMRRGATAFTSFDLGAAERYECGHLPHAAPPAPLSLTPEQRQNVLLISIDALRRDALDWVEGGRPVVPQLRSFAAHSLDFQRAVTTYPATLLAMGAALTGLSPAQLLLSPSAPENVFSLTRSRFKSRFAALPKSGWFGKPVVDKLLLQNIERERFPDANAQTAWFIRRLKKARREGGGLFGWIHYYEPHQSYLTHEGFDFGDAPRQRYMSELAYVDHHLGRLLRFLGRNHWYENTLVIVLADHGQALGERDYWGHHVYLNSWIADIPLFVRGPGVRPGKTTRLVDIGDVATTVMHFADMQAPASLGGRSLLAGATAADAARISVAEAFPIRGDDLFQTAGREVKDLAALRKRMDRLRARAQSYVPKVAAVSDTHRLIVDRATGHEELYDRVADRGERRDLAPNGGAALSQLRQGLKRWSALEAANIHCRVSGAEWNRPQTAGVR